MFYYDGWMSTDLDVEVKRLLEANRGEWPRVCIRAQVSHSWVSKFVRGEIPNPGFATLKRLHAALTTVGGESAAVPAPKAG
jgi:transcriptional regulator with XRE-family HTH domain